jgi:uncharacterized protein
MFLALYHRYCSTLILSTCWLFIISSTVVDAAIVKGLYDAKVEVAEQTQKAQRSAAREALSLVLIKVSGTRDILEHQQIKDKLRTASDFMRAYRFDLQEGKLFYLASFDAQKIDSLIMEAGFPIWDSRRPDSLLWLVIEEPTSLQRSVLVEESHGDLLALANNVASSRGIKITFPLMDLDDLLQINVYDIWGQFSKNIEAASQRYAPDIIISARFYQRKLSQPADLAVNEGAQIIEDEQIHPWLADWLLLNNGKSESGQFSADDSAELTQLLVELLADKLASQFAIDNKTLSAIANKVKLKVVNINSLPAYIEVARFLSSLTLVSKTTLINQKGTEATFELDIFGQEADLQNALMLDKKLSPKLDDFGLPGAELEYVWTP